MEARSLTFCVAAAALLASSVVFMAWATDPNQLQDFCVAINDPTSAVFVNGLFCKNPMKVTTEDFLFKGLNVPRITDAKQGYKATLVDATNFPGLNTLGISILRVEFEPNGLVPPHTHPRASEIFTVLEGTIYAGFISSSLPGGNKLFAKVLNPGDVFVFPQGLVHFGMNTGKKPAVAIGTYNSQNPGVVFVANTLFGADPPVPTNILAKTFQVNDTAVIKEIDAQF